jgi:hypothetical protein
MLGMKQRLRRSLYVGIAVLGFWCISGAAMGQSEDSAEGISMREPAGDGMETSEEEAMEQQDSAKDGKGAFFRIGIGAGWSRDQTIEYSDEYGIAQGIYVDVELAPGYSFDEYNAMHLWLHWQYPAISERGDYEPVNGEPVSVVGLGLGYTRSAEDNPFFASLNAGVVLSFVDTINNGLLADEIGDPGIGGAVELVFGPKFPVSEAVSLGVAGVTGVRASFTNEETFRGFYAGGRLIMALD